MYGIIYKIVNTVNDRVYVGQTIRTLDARFKRHKCDALRNVLPDNYFHRAIRKYGIDVFEIEKIDIAESKKELNIKEKYWIDYYIKLNQSYNTAEGGQGGNTYYKRTKKQMLKTKEKISKSNLGKNNGNAKSVEMYDTLIKKTETFETITACLKYFNIKNKECISRRASGKDDTLYKNRYSFRFKTIDK